MKEFLSGLVCANIVIVNVILWVIICNAIFKSLGVL